jgi:hypothetical protein
MLPVEIENIEEMRRRAGIQDEELEREIRGLSVGDYVKVTLLSPTKPFSAETLLVRITGIRGSVLNGKLASRPTAPGLSVLSAGAVLTFRTSHIHSIPNMSVHDEC